MELSTSSLLHLFICLLLLGNYGSMAQTRWERHSQCRVEKLNALHPTGRVQSEAGVTEFFDEKSDELRCAGVSAYRRIINRRGLLLPHFSNAPRLVYVIEGRGVAGYVIPGCPESFQIFDWRGTRREKFHGQGQSFSDQHQRLHRFRQGDIIAIPAGIAFWAFNDGESTLVTITVADTSSNVNQLDDNHRQFQLAGSQRGAGVGKPERTSFFDAFSTDMLAWTLGISRELAQKIQREDRRGEIVAVKEDLELVWPYSRKGEEGESRGSREEEEEEEERERRREEEWERERRGNGLEQLFCSLRFIENIDNPIHADVFNPFAGRLNQITSHKLPALHFVQLSAVRVVLQKRASMAPHWNLNAHSLVYVTRGRARVQVVDDRGKAVFDGQLEQGQLLLIPQNFAVLKRADDDGFEYIAFKTSENAIASQVFGKGSIFRGLPEHVVGTAYRLQREEARKIKFARADEVAIFADSSMQPQPMPVA
ncbi:hypothetical protein HPP92_005091 [Vanilla planifolia]|uniref:Cupin type-1 domain-containing protein n=1 Tax=Vanilla planifolia TaxID=51239 RepID=A0A835RXX6_VANPL|nr:hypothetical protein HPP92_005091 [Vanilla planifolia]